MPRFAAPSHHEESRKALEAHARQATMPASVKEKRKWPFPVANEESVSKADEDHKKSGTRDKQK